MRRPELNPAHDTPPHTDHASPAHPKLIGGSRLSLSGLGTLTPGSPAFASAVTGALLATIGIVIMLALAMRLASSSTVSLSELQTVQGKNSRALNWKRLFHPGLAYAADIVGAKTNGYLAGFETLGEFSEGAAGALVEHRDTYVASAEQPKDSELARAAIAAAAKYGWFQSRLKALVGSASYHRLQWNFGFTAALMTIAGSVAAVVKSFEVVYGSVS